MQKFSFKKGMAFALAATTALSGLPASPTVAYAATEEKTIIDDSQEAKTLTTTTLYESDIRVIDGNFTYNGSVQFPTLYYDKNKNGTFDASDVLLATSETEPTSEGNPVHKYGGKEDIAIIRNALEPTTVGSNINASNSASITIPQNTYKVDANTAYKFDTDINIPYVIKQADLSEATIQINGVQYSSGSLPRVTYSSGGVSFKLSNTAFGDNDNSADNIVNVYLGGHIVPCAESDIAWSTTGDKNAVAGYTYTLNLFPNEDSTNFESGKSATFQYVAVHSGLENAKVNWKPAYNNLEYNGRNQILSLNKVDSITLDGQPLSLDDFELVVTPSTFTKTDYDNILAYNNLKTDAEKTAFAAEHNDLIKNKYSSTASHFIKEPAPEAKNAGTYNVFIFPKGDKYSGYIFTNFTISRLDVTKLDVVNATDDNAPTTGVYFTVVKQFYTGKEIKPISEVKVRYSGLTIGTISSSETNTKNNTININYDKVINALEATDDYISALSKVGLAKVNDNTVLFYNVKSDASSNALLLNVPGADDNFTTFDSLDSNIKAKYNYNQQTWLAEASEVVNQAIKDYLPFATIEFKSGNFTGKVDVYNAFRIAPFNLSNCVKSDIVEAAFDEYNYSDYTYSWDDDREPILQDNGIRIKNGSDALPSDVLSAKYSSGTYSDKSWDELRSEKKDSINDKVKCTITSASDSRNVTGQVDVYFKTAQSLSPNVFNFELPTGVVFDGSKNILANKIKVVKKNASGNPTQLVEGTDYSLTYLLVEQGKNNSYGDKANSAGYYLIRARGKGAYAGTITDNITIAQKSIKNDIKIGTVSKGKYVVSSLLGITSGINSDLKTVSITYNQDGFDKTKGFDLVKDTIADYPLVYGTDYIFKFVDNTTLKEVDYDHVKSNPGNYSVILKGYNKNYKDEIDSEYDIVVEGKPLQLSNCKIKSTDGTSNVFSTNVNNAAEIYYTGNEIDENFLKKYVTVTVTENGKERNLEPDDEYFVSVTVKAKDVNDVGVITVSCPAKGHYSAPNISTYFRVIPGNLADENVYKVSLKGTAPYEDGSKNIDFDVFDTRTETIVPYVYDNSKINYSKNVTFESTPGKDAGILKIWVVEKDGDTSSNEDGTVSVTNGKVADGYSGNYVVRNTNKKTITKKVTFDTSASIAKQNIGGIADAEYTYSGLNQMPKIVIKKKTGEELKVDTDYEILIMDATETVSGDAVRDVLSTNNINDIDAGREIREGEYVQPYHIIIKGKGSYTGSVTYKLYILPQSIRDKNIVSINHHDCIYNGTEQTPVTVTFTDGNNVTRELKKDEDYSIIYQNNKNVGTATYIVKGKGNFSDEYSIYKNDDAKFEITQVGGDTKMYTEEQLAEEIKKALAENAASGNASSEEIQKIVNEAVAKAKEEATQGMITEEAAKAATKEAVENATKGMVSEADAKKAADDAAAEATKGMVSEADAKKAADDAAAEATKGMVSEADAKKAADDAAAEATKGMVSAADSKKAAEDAAAKATNAAKAVKKGDTFIVGKNIYQITNVSKKTAKFVGTYSKAKTITIPATAKNSKNSVSYKITTVAASAMKGNTTVTKVTIGKNVTKINGSAFQNCTKLATVTIGKSVKTIGKSAFNGDTKLKKVTIKSTKLKTVKSKAFKIAKKAKVTVPSGKASSYKKLLKSAGLPSNATVK